MVAFAVSLRIKFFQTLKKFFKYSLITILTIVLLLSGYLVITGQTYMFFLLGNTVMKGRLSPTIDDYTLFDNREVQIGQPTPWQRSTTYNRLELEAEEEAYHREYGSVAFVVIQNGELQFEKYWENYGPESKTNSWSMAKSIISHLIGCALRDGLIDDVDNNIGKYLEEYKDGKTTIRNLLTMSSGFNFDEDYLNPFSYPARSLYDSDIQKVHRKYQETGEPGRRFDYQSANTQLLAFILMKVTGKTLSDYASEKLWKPIGAVHPAFWSLDQKDGIEKAFCCFNTNALDFAKFGYLYLNRGIANGDTLIDTEYFLQATSPASELTDEVGKNMRYGYQWWTLSYQDQSIFYARGIKGQYIFVIPGMKVVIVRLGRERSSGRVNGHPEDIYRYIDHGIRLVK